MREAVVQDVGGMGVIGMREVEVQRRLRRCFSRAVTVFSAGCRYKLGPFAFDFSSTWYFDSRLRG